MGYDSELASVIQRLVALSDRVRKRCVAVGDFGIEEFVVPVCVLSGRNFTGFMHGVEKKLLSSAYTDIGGVGFVDRSALGRESLGFGENEEVELDGDGDLSRLDGDGWSKSRVSSWGVARFERNPRAVYYDRSSFRPRVSISPYMPHPAMSAYYLDDVKKWLSTMESNVGRFTSVASIPGKGGADFGNTLTLYSDDVRCTGYSGLGFSGAAGNFTFDLSSRSRVIRYRGSGVYVYVRSIRHRKTYSRDPAPGSSGINLVTPCGEDADDGHGKYDVEYELVSDDTWTARSMRTDQYYNIAGFCGRALDELESMSDLRKQSFLFKVSKSCSGGNEYDSSWAKVVPSDRDVACGNVLPPGAWASVNGAYAGVLTLDWNSGHLSQGSMWSGNVTYNITGGRTYSLTMEECSGSLPAIPSKDDLLDALESHGAYTRQDVVGNPDFEGWRNNDRPCLDVNGSVPCYAGSFGSFGKYVDSVELNGLADGPAGVVAYSLFDGVLTPMTCVPGRPCVSNSYDVDVSPTPPSAYVGDAMAMFDRPVGNMFLSASECATVPASVAVHGGVNDIQIVNPGAISFSGVKTARALLGKEESNWPACKEGYSNLVGYSRSVGNNFKVFGATHSKQTSWGYLHTLPDGSTEYGSTYRIDLDPTSEALLPFGVDATVDMIGSKVYAYVFDIDFND